MKIGVISDIHDRLDNLSIVMEQILEKNIEAIICLGDICSPASLRNLVKQTADLPFHFVFGNNDFEVLALNEIANNTENVTCHGQLGKIFIGGLNITMSHYLKSAESLVKSGDVDIALFGHTHLAAIHTVGKCTLANPGEIMGRTGIIGYGILDTISRKFITHRVLPHCL